MPALPIEDLQNAPKGESSDDVRQRVVAARNMAIARQGKANYELTVNELDQFAILGQKNSKCSKWLNQSLICLLAVTTVFYA